MSLTHARVRSDKVEDTAGKRVTGEEVGLQTGWLMEVCLKYPRPQGARAGVVLTAWKTEADR